MTRAELLAGTLHTCRSLSGESYFCGLWSTYSSLAPRLTGSARCSRALSHADYTEEPWFVQGKAQVFFHNPSKRRLRTGSSGAWVTGSKAVIMLLPHRFTGDKQHQRRTARTERRGLQFGGRGVHKDDVLVLHGSDVNSGFKARKYQLLEQHAAAPALSAEQQPERNKKKVACATAEPDPTLHQFETTGASDIRHVTRSEANSMQVIRQALSRFDDRKKIELLHKARNELIAEMLLRHTFTLTNNHTAHRQLFRVGCHTTAGSTHRRGCGWIWDCTVSLSLSRTTQLASHTLILALTTAVASMPISYS